MITDSCLTLEAVFDAYFDCRRTKRNSINQLRFECDLESNLVALYRDLAVGNYRIGRSIAFVVTHPKVREVWAADFRDRVVHHVIYRAIFDRFYAVSYATATPVFPVAARMTACAGFQGFTRSITRNWTRPAFFLKVDVANFFNSVDRGILVDLVERHVGEEWLRNLIRQVALHDPRPGAVIRSPASIVRPGPTPQEPASRSRRQGPADRQPDQSVFRQCLSERA